MKKNMEKINAQKNINLEAIRHYQAAYAEYNSLPYGYKPARLRSCTATVYETPHYFLLRSYNTVVACIDKSTGICYDVLRHVYGFTSTSCQHINKFKNELRGNYLKALQFNCYRRVRGKNGSRIEYEPFIPFT